MWKLPDALNADPQIKSAIELECRRQEDHIELIASENFVSEAVMAAQGSPLTNKYAEGYPGKRYYGGCEYVDIAEDLARDRVKELFGAEHANVQPHSGSQANLAAYVALLQPGDKVLGMSLSHGGHLTHGHPVNISGMYFHFEAYGLDPETERIDYDALREKALELRPKLILAGASAYSRSIDFERFRAIADEAGAYLMVDMAHIAGLVAAGMHPSPVPYADVVTSTTHKTLRGPRGGLILCKEPLAKAIDKAIFPGIQGGPLMHVIAAKAVSFQEALQPEFKTYQQQVIKNAKALEQGLRARGVRMVSDGTDNHLLLLDLSKWNIDGEAASVLLEEANLVVNKNKIPGDHGTAKKPSGIRLGTPALTSRGMKEQEVRLIARWVAEVVKHPEDKELRDRVKADVVGLCSRFPIYRMTY